MSGSSPVFTLKRKHLHVEVDRWGNVRVYFRKGRGPRVRIRETPGTEAFDQRYHELDADAAGALKPTPRDAPRPGTFRSLVQRYMMSPEFLALDPRTQRVRRQILDHMCAEPIAPGAKEIFRDCPVERFTGRAVRVLRDRKRDHPEAANSRVKVLRGVFKWALENEAGGVTTNPARDVPFLRPKRQGGFHTWTPEEVDQFERTHDIGSKARLALALLLYAGVRRSDCVLLGRQHIRDGRLRFTAQKNRNRKPSVIDIPVLPALQEAISASPTGDLTFLVTEFGKPYTRDGFGNWFRRQCRAAGLSDCSAHGLRKAGAVRAAENGATTSELMAIFGWATAKEAERYTREADRRRLTARAPQLLSRPNHEQNALTLDEQSPRVRDFRAKG